MAEVNGIELARDFFTSHVERIVVEALHRLADETLRSAPFSAGLVGPGSEVLGMDDATSRDHDWGPRCIIFVPPSQLELVRDHVQLQLGLWLPASFKGYSTNYGPPDPNDGGTRLRVDVAEGDIVSLPRATPLHHRVVVTSWAEFTRQYTGHDLTEEPLPTLAHWFRIPSQKLATLVHGALFRDDLNLEARRRYLRTPPPVVKTVALARWWTRISQEEHLMGRCGMRGDEIGAALIAGRLAKALMHVVFLVEGRYAPYAKWLGSVFRTLPAVVARPALPAALLRLITASDKDSREQAYIAAARDVLSLMGQDEQYKSGRFADLLPEQPVQFFGRPILVFAAGPAPHIEELLLKEQAPLEAAAAGADAEALVAAAASCAWFGPLEAVSDDTDACSDVAFGTKLF